jgi:hypothetical protein
MRVTLWRNRDLQCVRRRYLRLGPRLGYGYGLLNDRHQAHFRRAALGRKWWVLISRSGRADIHFRTAIVVT